MPRVSGRSRIGSNNTGHYLLGGVPVPYTDGTLTPKGSCMYCFGVCCSGTDETLKFFQFILLIYFIVDPLSCS